MEDKVLDGSEDFVITILPESWNKYTPSYLRLRGNMPSFWTSF